MLLLIQLVKCYIANSGSYVENTNFVEQADTVLLLRVIPDKSQQRVITVMTSCFDTSSIIKISVR